MNATLTRFINPRPVLETAALGWSKSWWVILSGIFEPIFYLLGMGLGVGGLVGDITLEGQTVSYTTFVAAGMMAAAAMNGAVYDATFNFYFKLRERRAYDSMLYSPLRPRDIVSGEVAWAVSRGGVYAAIFMVVSLLFGAIESWWAVFSVPAAFLMALVAAALGAFATTFVRSWADFDLMEVVMAPLFLASTTFFPLAVFPGWVQPIVQVSPLYNGVALIRDLNTGLVGWHDVGHVIYLVAVGLGFGYLTTRRLFRVFRT